MPEVKIMRVLKVVGLLSRKIGRLISILTTGAVTIAKTLFGVYIDQDGRTNTRQPLAAGITYLIGIPIGSVLFGPGFIFWWAWLVVGGLVLLNLHNAIVIGLAMTEGGLEYTVSQRAKQICQIC